mgnify:CR=1 FL=1
MIDIKPFTDKLDRLSEYMGIFIENKSSVWWINLGSIPRMNPETFFRLYAETGVMFFDGNQPPLPTRISFDEWLETQSQQSTTINN